MVISERSVNGYRKSGAEGRRVLGNHHCELQVPDPFFSQRQTDEPPAMGGHEIDGLGSDLLRRHAEITLVLAVFVIHQDDHSAPSNLFDGLFNSSQWHGFLIYPSWHDGSTAGRRPLCLESRLWIL